MLKSNLITIVLPLLDRSNYTKIWVKENIFDDINYVVADGSTDDANQLIFDDLKEHPNVKYIRYPHDATIEDFIRKIINTIDAIETPYVMMVDNDDFLNRLGLSACIEALEADKSIGSCHGIIKHIAGVSKTNNVAKLYRLQRQINDPIMLHDKSGIHAIQNLYKPYSYLWYGVYRTRVCKSIWEKISQSKINNVFLLEMLHSQLACYFAKIHCIRFSHYIRLSNSVSRAAVQLSSKEYPTHHGIYFDENYRGQVLQMAEFMSKLLGVDKKTLYDEYRLYYSTISYPRRMRQLVCDEIMNRCYNYLMPAFSINMIRRFLSYRASG